MPAVHLAGSRARARREPDLTSSGSSKLPQPRVLVLDEGATHARYERALRGCGLETLPVASGQAAVQIVAAGVSDEPPVGIAFLSSRLATGWQGRDLIDHLWHADPRLQIVFCAPGDNRSWSAIETRAGSNGNLLLFRRGLEDLELLQLTRTLAAKWRAEVQGREGRGVEAQVAQLHAANEALKREIAERREEGKKHEHNALHDTLTSLPNRAMLMDRLAESLKRYEAGGGNTSGGSGRHVAVLFMDLDNFKLINDSMGHEVGDQLLIDVAGAIAGSLRAVDTVSRMVDPTAARLGGDEFVVVLDGVTGPESAVQIAERILEHVSEPRVLAGQEVSVGASIGIAISGPGCCTANQLLRAADTAMYRAKQEGRSRCAVFSEEMHTIAMARLKIENALRLGLERSEHRVVYQPIVQLDSGRVAALEALLRWRHPEQGCVPPAEFIPLAEELGLIVHLGRFVLEQACEQLRLWNDGGGADEPVAVNVNVSARQLVLKTFLDDLQAIVRNAGVDPCLINLELTESTVMEGSGTVEGTLHRIKELGCSLHMDDFGTGYSSLSCLQRFPFDVLKIDRAFIKTLERGREVGAIVHSIVSLATNLNKKVTAEGIESAESLTQVIALGCEFGQGYLFSRPLEADQVLKCIHGRPEWLDAIHIPPGAVRRAA